MPLRRAIFFAFVIRSKTSDVANNIYQVLLPAFPSVPREYPYADSKAKVKKTMHCLTGYPMSEETLFYI